VDEIRYIGRTGYPILPQFVENIYILFSHASLNIPHQLQGNTMDIGSLLSEASETIKIVVPILKDIKVGNATLRTLADPAQKFWGWLTERFKGNKAAEEQIKEIEQNPQDAESLGGLRYALKSLLLENPELQKSLSEQLDIFAEEYRGSGPHVIKYVQNNYGTQGPVFQNFQGTFNYHEALEKKSKND
jgi:hypothetical protein